MAVGSLKRSSIAAYTKYDSMLAGNAFTPTTFDYEHLGTTVLSSSQASVTFTLPSNAATEYKHLQLRIAAVPTADTLMQIRFNGDTAANYSYHGLQGYGTGIDSFSGVSQTAGWLGYSPVGSTFPSVAILDLLDPFNDTKYKTTRSLYGSTQSGGNRIMLMSSSWRSTATVTSVTILTNTGNYLTGSRFSIYGVKG